MRKLVSSMPRKASGFLPWIVLAIGLISYFRVILLQDAKLGSQHQPTATMPMIPHPEFNGSSVHELRERIRLLETKLNTYMNYESDPFLNNKLTSQCQNKSNLREYCASGASCAMGDMKVCLPDIRPNGCIVYDFGIRNEPDFGVVLSQPPFNCQVFAFDPSPITRSWYERNKKLRELSNYRLFLYGGGAQDETIALREYDWGQVSVYQYPSSVVNASDCYTSGPNKGKCRFAKFGRQKNHPLPVRSVTSIMQELGHDRIDILKLDVEGSEYRMLESLISTGTCRQVDQLTLEWHHFGWDVRYGHGSDPHLNVLHRLLHEQCGLYQFALHSPTGWPSNEEMFAKMQLPLYYNLASFRRQIE